MTHNFPRVQALVVICLAVSASSLTGQTDSVYLVHGFRSDGPAWTNGKNILQQRFPAVSFTAPTNGWDQPFSTQAMNLVAAMNGATNNIVAVGHSNGGTVLRTVGYNGNILRAGVTLGSPQQGAPLADNGRSGTLWSTMDNYWTEVTRASRHYNNYYPDEMTWWASFWGGRYASYYNAFLNYLWDYVGMNTSTHVASHTILADMGEYGWANTYLNGSGYRPEIEPTRIPSRYSVIYRFLGYGVMWKGLTPGMHNSATGHQFSLYDTFMSNYWGYQWYDNYDDPDMWEKRANAYMWFASAIYIENTDMMWCGLIGAQESDENGDYCDSDGIVPVRSMYWPGSTTGATVSGLGHLEETSHTNSMNAVEFVLREIGLP
jgi:hypothetical protein